jgi:hypothetical protein
VALRFECVNYLLLPDDEAPLRSYLAEELGLTPLGHSSLESSHLPRHASPGVGRWEFVYWAESLGPIRRLAETPVPRSATGRVMDRLNRESLGAAWGDAVDLARTPVIRFRRASWNRNGHLNPGVLRASAAPATEQPPQLLSLRRRVARWIEQEGERLNPFEHCVDSPVPQPRSLGPFWVWARPHALDWVRDGGRVWPWSA